LFYCIFIFRTDSFLKKSLLLLTGFIFSVNSELHSWEGTTAFLKLLKERNSYDMTTLSAGEAVSVSMYVSRGKKNSGI
jgi:hypothetical protein